MTKLKFFEKLDLLDSLINSVGESNYDDAFEKISVHFDNPYICQYFFEQIEDEKWLDAIIASEFIKKYRSGNIPGLLNNQFDWFFMGYLLKVAEHIAEPTSSYIKSIISLNDERLHQRMIEVMLRLPCNVSADLAAAEIEWCRTKDNLFGLYPDFAGKRRF